MNGWTYILEQTPRDHNEEEDMFWCYLEKDGHEPYIDCLYFSKRDKCFTNGDCWEDFYNEVKWWKKAVKHEFKMQLSDG